VNTCITTSYSTTIVKIEIHISLHNIVVQKVEGGSEFVKKREFWLN